MKLKKGYISILLEQPFLKFMWIILIDSYSKFPYAIKMKDNTTESLIYALQTIFTLEVSSASNGKAERFVRTFKTSTIKLMRKRRVQQKIVYKHF